MLRFPWGAFSTLNFVTVVVYAQGSPLGILLFLYWLVHSKALSWEIVTYCSVALLRDFVRIQTQVMRPFMGACCAVVIT